MESYDATNAVYLRIQTIDPNNARKIIGFLMLHYNDNDMIRLACGPETLLLSVLNKAKSDLGISSNISSASSVTQISNPISISKPNPLSLSISSSRLSNNEFNPSSPSSPSLWPNHPSLSLNSSPTLSYAAVVNGGSNTTNGSYSSSLGSPSPQIVGDEYHYQDQNLSFFSDSLVSPSKKADFFDQHVDVAVSPGCRSDSVLYPYNWGNPNAAENNAHFHRRSSSFNDVYFRANESTYDLPCVHHAKGFCKHGSSCNFIHGSEFTESIENSGVNVGSPCKSEAFEPSQEDILRSRLAYQQRRYLGMNLPYNRLNFPYYGAQRSGALALMMEEEIQRLNRTRIARNDFSLMGMRGGDSTPASRQIYLTFPADSTFKEEDVSQYFSRFGPVEDVRIPYQQPKRMFGFVTFVYPETVNLIFAKGNPHFVCDSRVLVKPYKEKGKLPDKRQQQQDRAEFLCPSPSGLDSGDSFEFPLGGRMSYNSQERMLLRRNLEHADLEHALELQGRRLANMHLLDLKNIQNTHHNLAVGSPVLSPIMSRAFSNHNATHPFEGTSHDVSEELEESPIGASNPEQAEEDNVAGCDHSFDILKEDKFANEEPKLPERLSSEHDTERVEHAHQLVD